MLDQELGAAARHEDAGIHGDPQAAELGPAQDLFQRQAGGPALDQGGKLARGPGGGDEQPGFVLGEDAARGPEPGHDEGLIHFYGSASRERRTYCMMPPWR